MLKLKTKGLAVLSSGIALGGCGREYSRSAHSLSEHLSSAENGRASELVVPSVHWCGNNQEFKNALEESYNQFVNKLSQVCNEQNLKERSERRFACGENECMESITTGTSSDGRRLKIALYNVPFTGAIGLQMTWLQDHNYWNRTFPPLGANCVHASIFAETHLGLREKLVEKSFEARTNCSAPP